MNEWTSEGRKHWVGSLGPMYPRATLPVVIAMPTLPPKWGPDPWILLLSVRSPALPSARPLLSVEDTLPAPILQSGDGLVGWRGLGSGPRLGPSIRFSGVWSSRGQHGGQWPPWKGKTSLTCTGPPAQAAAPWTPCLNENYSLHGLGSIYFIDISQLNQKYYWRARRNACWGGPWVYMQSSWALQVITQQARVGGMGWSLGRVQIVCVLCFLSRVQEVCSVGCGRPACGAMCPITPL